MNKTDKSVIKNTHHSRQDVCNAAIQVAQAAQKNLSIYAEVFTQEIFDNKEFLLKIKHLGIKKTSRLCAHHYLRPKKV